MTGIHLKEPGSRTNQDALLCLNLKKNQEKRQKASGEWEHLPPELWLSLLQPAVASVTWATGKPKEPLWLWPTLQPHTPSTNLYSTPLFFPYNYGIDARLWYIPSYFTSVPLLSDFKPRGKWKAKMVRYGLKASPTAAETIKNEIKPGALNLETKTLQWEDNEAATLSSLINKSFGVKSFSQLF